MDSYTGVLNTSTYTNKETERNLNHDFSHWNRLYINCFSELCSVQVTDYLYVTKVIQARSLVFDS